MQPLNIPSRLLALVAGRSWHRVETGCSAATVFRLTAPARPALYLKTAPSPAHGLLAGEQERLVWLRGRLSVPQVLGFEIEEGGEFLLLTEVAGKPAHEFTARDAAAVVPRLAESLRRLHALPAADCPFDHSADAEIARARRQVDLGLVDESDFDPARRGRSVASLFDELIRLKPECASQVFTHGDFCPPNILFADSSINGFVDLGRAGLGDPARDLALAIRSLECNFGAEWISCFLEAYGERPDAKRIEFYALLDEFF